MDILKYLNNRLEEKNEILTVELISKFLSLFNNGNYNNLDYQILKSLIKEKKCNLPSNFKNNSNVLEDFIEENLDLTSFEESAWNKENIEKYISKLLLLYKTQKHFEIPKSLYKNRKIFYSLLKTGLIVADREYYFKGQLNEEDIERYIDFLRETNLYYIPNKSNYCNNPFFLKSIIKNGMIECIDSFKKEAWNKENILLYINCADKNSKIPHPLYESDIFLKYTINNKNTKELNNFKEKAWTKSNIELAINLNIFREIKVPSYLLNNDKVLEYILKNNIAESNRFNEKSWTSENIELFKKIIIKKELKPHNFPVNLRYNSEILYHCLKNNLFEYIDIFLIEAFTEENIEIFKEKLKENKINNIPSVLNERNDILKYCISNRLINYIKDFKSQAFQTLDTINYINLFEKPEDIIFSSGLKNSRAFLHTIMFTNFDLLVNFSNKVWDEEYIYMLFDIVASQKGNKHLRDELIEKYNSIKNEKIKRSFRNYIINNKERFGDIDKIIEILKALENTNSSELKHIASEVADYTLSKEDPTKEFERIERIFLSNELPSIAKTYNIFKTFHSNKDGSLWINQSPYISPVLKHYSLRQRGSLFCEAIIFSDLLKATAGSNNKSLINYLKNLKKSDILLRKISKDETKIEEIDVIELTSLKSYLQNLTAIYNQSLKGKNNTYTMTNNLKKDIKNLLKLYEIDGIDNILNRVVRMYANFIGVKTYDEMIEYIENKVKMADQRGRNYEKKPFNISKGDFIKGINDISFLPNILNNGVVASEFLGSSAKKTGDLTPFDTDGSLVQEDRTIDETFNNNDLAALYYGQTWIVFKTEGKVQLTRDNEKEIESHYKQDKVELFHNGSNGIDHYGIRTGFPSTDIDYIVTREYNSKIGFEIARNGFYIPVIDTKGNILFTSKMYDNIRSQMNGLSFYGVEKYDFSDNLILPGIEQKIKEIDRENNTSLIRKKLDEALSKFELIQNNKLDGNLSRNIYNFIDIGSTGRGTDIKGEADYDFMLMLDQRIMNDNKLLDKVKKSIMIALGKETLNKDDHIYNGNFRFKNVQIADKKIDIDISFEGKTDKIAYTSDMAIKDRLDTMEKTSKEKTLLAKANIIIAKELLKKNRIYKSINSEEREGGLGGIGVENWILSHGGSLIDASISFLNAYDEACERAKRDSEKIIEFTKIYKIWNFGENYYSINTNKPLHNEFVKENLSNEGLKKMAKVLKGYLKSIDIEYERKKITKTLP